MSCFFCTLYSMISPIFGSMSSSRTLSYDNFHRNRTWFLWADSRLILVYRKLSSCDILDRDSGSSRFFYLSIGSTNVWGNCEDGVGISIWPEPPLIALSYSLLFASRPYVDEHKLARKGESLYFVKSINPNGIHDSSLVCRPPFETWRV